MIPIPTINPWQLLAKLVALLLVVGFGFVAGNKYATNRDAKTITELQGQIKEVQTAAEVQKKHNEEVIAEQQRINEDTTNGWKAALDYTREFYAHRVLPKTAGGPGAMPGISRAPTRIDDIPADALPLAEQCAETTLMLETLQHWVTVVRSIK